MRAVVTADPIIPPPNERFIRLLATRAFEAVEGIRSISQLGASVSIGAARALAMQRTALSERRQLCHDTRRYTPVPGRAHICQVLPTIAEVAVVLHTERRSYAAALRLEWVHGRWRAQELSIL